MENVAYDLPQYYPPISLPPFAEGEVDRIFFNEISFLRDYLDSKYDGSFMYRYKTWC
jgi:hypothetical protein